MLATCLEPSKNLQDHARFLQDCARILHARLAWHMLAICPFSCTILALSCKNLACKTCMAHARDMSLFLHDSCTILQDLAHISQEMCKRCCKNNYLQVWSFLHHFLQEILQDSARIVQEIACTCHASLACKILAQSCMILQVRFCWEVLRTSCYSMKKLPFIAGPCSFLRAF